MELLFNVEDVIAEAHKVDAKCIALQFPEGLLSHAWELSEQITAHWFSQTNTEIQVVVLGEPAFGSCCADDILARSIGAQLLVHFGHSRVVPQAITDSNGFSCFYVPVIAKQSSWSTEDASSKIISGLPSNVHTIVLVTTAQFLPGLPNIVKLLETDGRFSSVKLLKMGQLSPGEILGCTAPHLLKTEADAIVYVGDGRFHVEAAAIASPQVQTWRYDPQTKLFSKESLDYETLERNRFDAISFAQKSITRVGIAISTLGRQASMTSLKKIEDLLNNKKIEYFAVLLDDICPDTLEKFHCVDVWVQLACPRLSIDWSSSFKTPILTSYEAIQAFSIQQPQSQSQSQQTPIYMDNWSSGNSHYRE